MSLFRTPSIARLANRAILSVSGSQASEFLNGIFTVATKGRPTYSALLHAQGRVLYDTFLYTTTDDSTGQKGYLIEHDSRPSDAPPLYSMLKKYLLRSKVKIRDITEQYDVWASWGSPLDCPLDASAREWQWASSGAIEPAWNNPDAEWPWGAKDHALLDRRAIGMGSRFIVRKGDQPQTSSHDIKSSDDYTLHRLLLGIPEGSIDMPPMQAFPIESNMDITGGLDFRKGCYIGQELTVRTYHTGMVRKRILPVAIRHPQSKPPESISPDPSAPSYTAGLDIRPVVIQKDDSRSAPRPRGTGKLLTSMQGLGLALLRLEHVEAVLNGNMELQFQDGERAWTVSPRWPSWWPRRQPE